MNSKDTFTKIFLKQSNIPISPVSIKEYMPMWWQNTRSKDQGGLRLTSKGFAHLRSELDLKFYEIPLPHDQTIATQTILFLDKFITCPYYLDRSSLWVTEEKKAIELHLFSGDLRKYGLVKAMSRYNKEENGIKIRTES